MESWMFQVVVLIGTMIAGYVWLKYTVASHVEDIKSIRETHKEHRKDIEARFEAGVKRFEELNHQISQLLDKESADRKYATRELLDLHMRNMERDIRDVKESNVEMGKKLDHLIGVLSTNIVRTITPHGAVFGGSHQ